MPAPRTALGDDPNVSRRDFLTKRLPGGIAGLLGGGAAAAPSLPTAEAGQPAPAGSFSPRDLAPMTRDEVKAALARIRARGKER
jgi:hypothetical protein